MDAYEIARRFSETDRYIEEMDKRLRLVARQNSVLGDMVQLVADRAKESQARFQLEFARIEANLSALSAKFEDVSDIVNATAHVHTEEEG